MWSFMKSRRVGTVTLGVGLILTGIFSILSLFTNWMDIVFILKLSPILLIMLGTEMLVYTVANKEERIKYDGLAVFISFILITGTLALSAALVLFQRTIRI